MKTEEPFAYEEDTSPSRDRGPNVAWQRPRGRSYLLKASYRQISLSELYDLTEAGARDYLACVRWGSLGDGVQACPRCSSVSSHYRCESIGGWKCREKLCGKQFTVLSGTRLHGMKMPAKTILSILFHFVEAKDSISARQMSGLHDFAHQTIYVLGMKMREALRETQSAEPKLTGYVQADAAYFIKYVRPGNHGNGAANTGKNDQKNAGLDENAKTKNTVSPNMHALVVFAQAGQQGFRHYKVAMVKTETAVDMRRLSLDFCDENAALVTDQHGAYNVFSADFDNHLQVNHSQEFQTEDGINTNLVELVFSRIRAATRGAWHRMSIQHLEEYGWEFAWRQTMVGRSNLEQLEDLMRRVLTSGRPTRFVDYWQKRPETEPPRLEEVGALVEVSKQEVKKRRGRPSAGTANRKRR